MTTIYVNKDALLPERMKNDLYTTEWSLVRTAISTYAPLYATSVLDIGAYDGRWGLAAAERNGARALAGVELEDMPKPAGFTHWYGKQDYLEWDASIGFSLIVSNPPYNIAEKIIRKAWTELLPGGAMIMLLRLAFQSSLIRYQGLWNEIYPHTVAVCSRRPSFYGGGTNGTDYGIYVWEKSPDGEPLGEPRRWRSELLIYEREKGKNVRS